MTADKYPVLTGGDHVTYEFLSEGPKGTIKKVVVFQELDQGVFNLAFGDWDEIHQRIDDTTRSNNNDRDKVLATVASTVVDFIKHYPDAVIVAEGITPGKTRLYQMGINQHWKEARQIFDIRGSQNGNWTTFKPGNNYEAFAVKAREKS
jgi:hypothetical protein